MAIYWEKLFFVLLFILSALYFVDCCYNVENMICEHPKYIKVQPPQCVIAKQENTDKCRLEITLTRKMRHVCNNRHDCTYKWPNDELVVCKKYNISKTPNYHCVDRVQRLEDKIIKTLEEDSEIWVVFVCIAVFLFLFVIVDMILYQSNRGCIHKCSTFCCSDYEEIDSGLNDSRGREEWVIRKKNEF